MGPFDNPRRILDAIFGGIGHDVALLAKLVAIGSPTDCAAGVDAVQHALRGELELLGLRCELIVEPGRGHHLVARTAAAQAADPSVFLVAHVDTVHPVNPERDRLQVRGKIPDRIADRSADNPVVPGYGPGSLDLKGGVVCALSALRFLSAAQVLSAIPVTLFVNACEEDGTDHSASFVGSLARSASAALVCEFGRTAAAIVTRRKGLRTYRVTATGQAAHSGLASAPNAIARLFRLGPTLEQLARTGDGLTLNLGTIVGGTKANVVADRATLEFEIRAPALHALDSAEAAIRQALPDDAVMLERTSHAPPMEESPASAALYESFARVGRSVGLDCERAPLQGGMSDANYFAASGVPTIDGLGPWGEGAHTHDEYIDLLSIPYKAASLALWLHQSSLVPIH